jgi:hypothetical protein
MVSCAPYEKQGSWISFPDIQRQALELLSAKEASQHSPLTVAATLRGGRSRPGETQGFGYSVTTVAGVAIGVGTEGMAANVLDGPMLMPGRPDLPDEFVAGLLNTRTALPPLEVTPAATTTARVTATTLRTPAAARRRWRSWFERRRTSSIRRLAASCSAGVGTSLRDNWHLVGDLGSETGSKCC